MCGAACPLRFYSAGASNFTDKLFTQYRRPVSVGPSGKTWPRCPPHFWHKISVRTMPWLISLSSLTTSPLAARSKLGHPQPASNLLVDSNSASPQPRQWYIPSSKTFQYSPVNALSVPFSRRTVYSSAVSWLRHYLRYIKIKGINY